MFNVKNGKYLSVKMDWDNITLPLNAGTPVSLDGAIANDDTAIGIVPQTVTVKPIIPEIYILNGGDVDLDEIEASFGDELDEAAIAAMDGIRFWGANGTPVDKPSSGGVQEDIIVVSSQEATGVAYDDDVKFALSPDAGYDPSSYVGKTAVLTITDAGDTYTYEGVVKPSQNGPYFSDGDSGLVGFDTNNVVVIFAGAAGSPFEGKTSTFELKVSGSDGGGQNDFVVVDVNYDGSTFTSNYTYEQVRSLVDSGAKMAVRSGGAFFDYYGHTSSTVIFVRISVYGNVLENRVIMFKNDDTITAEVTKYNLTSLLIPS